VDLIVALFLCLYLPVVATNLSNKLFIFASTTWNFSHHLLQMLFALMIMGLPFWGKSLHEWGFNTNNSDYTLKIVKKFCIGFAVCLPVGTIITQVLSGWQPILTYPATWLNYLINLSFSVTMPGVSEEILFRALGMGILSRNWKNHIRIGNITLSYANMFSSVIFALAHIGFTIFPFEIVYYNPMQLTFALGLGLLYGYVYEKTNSLLGPILLHNASDGIAVTTYFLITKLFMNN